MLKGNLTSAKMGTSSGPAKAATMHISFTCEVYHPAGCSATYIANRSEIIARVECKVIQSSQR